MFCYLGVNKTTLSKMPEALINNEISHEDFMTIINEEGNYQESKEGIRTIKSKRSDTGKN